MKKTILAGIMATLFSSAAYANNDIVEVPITDVQPNYSVSEIRVPVNTCTQQLVPVTKNGDSINFNANNIIGGVIGGILGNQIGKGSGNTAATAAGAVIGAVIAGNHAQQSHVHYENRVVCNTTYRIQQKTFVDGYLVSYIFNGLTYTTRTAFRPYGDTLKLRVNHSVQQ
tara:strand:- start:190 stop:699 length:510 start_codon:yes stop_codon:yes gene_type:complete